MYDRHNPPKPWRDEHDLTELEARPEYAEDSFSSEMWPKGGWIDDFITHTYGRETTNQFAFWTAVAGLSGIVQRDCSLLFGNHGLFANFFVILVAPPGLCHKSTAMQMYEDIERKGMSLITNPDLLEEKKYKAIRGKTTAEAMFDVMQNKKYTSAVDHTERMTTAKLILRISELTTFLSKAQYNAQLVDKITDFYDCKAHDTDITRGGGAKELHNIYASLFAATTPDHLKHSIPEQAFGGGFMSRTVIVNQDIGGMKRIVPIPYIPPECPDVEEMAERLAWLVRVKHGTYKMTQDAYRFYEGWYRKEILELRDKASKGETDHRNNRRYIHVLKLALMIAIQRYDTKMVVTTEDLEYAIRIINYTFDEATDTVESIYLSSIEDGGMIRFLRIVRDAGKEGVTRVSLGRNHGFKRYEIDNYLEEFISRELMEEKRVDTGEKTPTGKPKTEKRILYKGD